MCVCEECTKSNYRVGIVWPLAAGNVFGSRTMVWAEDAEYGSDLRERGVSGNNVLETSKKWTFCVYSEKGVVGPPLSWWGCV